MHHIDVFLAQWNIIIGIFIDVQSQAGSCHVKNIKETRESKVKCCLLKLVSFFLMFHVFIIAKNAVMWWGLRSISFICFTWETVHCIHASKQCYNFCNYHRIQSHWSDKLGFCWFRKKQWSSFFIDAHNIKQHKGLEQFGITFTEDEQ